MIRARMLMTKVSLKYPFKNVKICNYMPYKHYFISNTCFPSEMLTVSNKLCVECQRNLLSFYIRHRATDFGLRNVMINTGFTPLRDHRHIKLFGCFMYKTRRIQDNNEIEYFIIIIY